MSGPLRTVARLAVIALIAAFAGLVIVSSLLLGAAYWNDPSWPIPQQQPVPSSTDCVRACHY